MLRIALVVLALTASAVEAAPESFRVSGIEPGSVLHVRERPEAEAEAVAHIPWNARGARVRLHHGHALRTYLVPRQIRRRGRLGAPALPPAGVGRGSGALVIPERGR